MSGAVVNLLRLMAATIALVGCWQIFIVGESLGFAGEMFAIAYVLLGAVVIVATRR